MAEQITRIETMTISVPVNKGIFSSDFPHVLWVHTNTAPWRKSISFDTFELGGLTFIQPIDGQLIVTVVNPSTGLTNVPTTEPGEVLISGLYRQSAVDPGIQFWISVIVGGIDFNPASSFPTKIDDFGPLKVPAIAGDIPSIDYYQYLISVSTKSAIDLDVLKSLKNTLTPKMILAKDINWVRNAVIAVQNVYYTLKEQVEKLTAKVIIIEEEIVIIKDDLDKLEEFVHEEFYPEFKAFEKNAIDGLINARTDAVRRTYVNLASYGVGRDNWGVMPTSDEKSSPFDLHDYKIEDNSTRVNLNEFFKTLIVKESSNEDSAVVIKKNAIGFFDLATNSDVQNMKAYDILLSVGSTPSLVLGKTKGIIRLGYESGDDGYLTIEGNEEVSSLLMNGSDINTIEMNSEERNSIYMSGMRSTIEMEGIGESYIKIKGQSYINFNDRLHFGYHAGPSPTGAIAGALNGGRLEIVGAELESSIIVGNRFSWATTTGTDDVASFSEKVKFGVGEEVGAKDYIYQIMGQGNGVNKEGFVLCKSGNYGVNYVYTATANAISGIVLDLQGLKLYGIAPNGIEGLEAEIIKATTPLALAIVELEKKMAESGKKTEEMERRTEDLEKKVERLERISNEKAGKAEKAPQSQPQPQPQSQTQQSKERDEELGEIAKTLIKWLYRTNGGFTGPVSQGNTVMGIPGFSTLTIPAVHNNLYSDGGPNT